jgi:hypothetical protein
MHYIIFIACQSGKKNMSMSFSVRFEILTVLLVKMKVLWWRHCAPLKCQQLFLSQYGVTFPEELHLHSRASSWDLIVIFYSSMYQFNNNFL